MAPRTKKKARRIIPKVLSTKSDRGGRSGSDDDEISMSDEHEEENNAANSEDEEGEESSTGSTHGGNEQDQAVKAMLEKIKCQTNLVDSFRNAQLKLDESFPEKFSNHRGVAIKDVLADMRSKYVALRRKALIFNQAIYILADRTRSAENKLDEIKGEKDDLQKSLMEIGKKSGKKAWADREVVKKVEKWAKKDLFHRVKFISNDSQLQKMGDKTIAKKATDFFRIKEDGRQVWWITYRMAVARGITDMRNSRAATIKKLLMSK